ncbi:MAG: hypothetical protein ACRC9Y_14055 [Aeromonas veronii]
MTNEEISALSDQQINVMVNKFEWQNRASVSSDYCNDHAIMMPIVFENGIALSPTRQTNGEMAWTAGYFMGRVVTKFTHANPLRAAAIVYLKMKGVL